MKVLNRVRGYTITETMFFLVITATLLASGILVFSGRNQRTQYTQSIRETDQQIRTIINEVSSGFFPSSEVNCTNPNPAVSMELNIPDIFTAGTGNDEQGTRTECVFLGKVIHFNKGQLDVYTLAGARKTASDANPTNLIEAKPHVVSAFDQSYDISYSIDAFRATGGSVCDAGPENTAAIAILRSLGSIDASGDPKSGAQTTEFKVICNTSVGQSESDIKELLNDLGAISENYKTLSGSGFKVCMGDAARHGSITIGGNAQKFGTTTIIDDDSGDCE
ncbi:MAG: hypothetical protein M3P98_00865 [bacterium]|nr:hypothetical protein [bacterium]